jgi:hypothetical protein
MLRAQSNQRYHLRSRTLRLAFAAGTIVAILCFAFSPAYATDPPPNNPPEIEWFAISEGPGNTYEFYGYVSDPDNSTEGYTVTFSGVVSGISATVESDGSFEEVFYLPNVQSGLVLADTEDAQGASADTAAFDLYVTQ